MQPKNLKLQLIVIAFCTSAAIQAHAQQPNANVVKTPEAVNSPANVPARRGYSFTLVKGDGNVYGYDIFNNGTLVLHQVAQAGKNKTLTLSTQIQASRAANYIIYKLQHNLAPYTLTEADLKKITVN